MTYTAPVVVNLRFFNAAKGWDEGYFFIGSKIEDSLIKTIAVFTL